MHSEIMVYATPNTQEQFKKVVSNWEYEVEGDLVKGTIKPLISEIKLYDIRLPKEVMPQFLADINARDMIDRKELKLFGRILKFIRRIFGFKSMNRANESTKHKRFTGSWCYCFHLGSHDDTKIKNVFTLKMEEAL